MECAWQVEIDEFAQTQLENHWSIVKKYRDVRECMNLEKVDLIAGGFPCQPVSVAGKQLGEKDERWLWDEYFRIVCETKPSWVVVENVAGLRSARNGRLFGEILRDLAALRYDAEWFSIFSGEKFGLPHKRERVFLLAYPASFGWNILNGKTRDKIERLILQIREQPGPRWRSKDGGYSSKSVGWVVEPGVCGANDGLPSKLAQARIKALGNAVVPQVAEFIGRMIMEKHNPE